MKQQLIKLGTVCASALKRAPYMVAALSLLVSVAGTNLLAARASAATVQNLKATPRVSFTFDDGLVSALTNAVPALAPYGITGTDYVITDCVGKTGTNNGCAADPNANYMTWDQIAQLKAAGWEIASHTKSHIQLSTDKPTAAALLAQLKDSQTALAAHGYAATNLAFPYGDYDTNVLAQTAKYYESARGFADLGYNTWPYDSTLIVNEQVQDGVTVATVKSYIDTAIANNQWLVLTFHEISAGASSGNPDDYQFSKANLAEIAAYVKLKQDTNLIKAVNVDDGLVRGTNLLPNGDFSQGIAAGWTTDDATNIKADALNNGRYPDPTHSVSVKSAAAATTASNTHLFSPQVTVNNADSYIIKNYVNLLGGGEIAFYVDEYAADGTTWLSGQYFAGMTYSATANAINTRDLNFKYTPTSANVGKARLQIIVHGASVNGYVDGSTWMSVNETAPVNDTVAPTISAVTAGSLTSTGATINWTTNEAATSQVEYGITTAYGQATAQNSNLATSQSVVLTALTASTAYHYRVISKDAAGNTTTSVDYTFTTTATSAAKAGDINGDSKVDIADLSILSNYWGSTTATAAQGDLNADGKVDIADLSILSNGWGK